MLICGASFAGLAVARELAGATPRRRLAGAGPDARPLRGRRAPDLGVRDPDVLARGARPDGLAPPDLRRAGGDHAARDRALAAAVDLLDLRLPASSARCSSSRATASSRPPRSTAAPGTPCTPTAATSPRPLIVDALGWRRMLARDDGFQPPDAPLSRGLEVHPSGQQRRPRRLDRPRRSCRPGYGWSFPAARSCGSASAPSTRAST